MKKILISSFAASALLFTVSCKTDFETDISDVVVTNGTADFSKYIALGNSLTSGFRDNALYLDGQNESFPSMIAAQMQLAGGGVFKQPLMPNNSGGFSDLPGFPGKLVLNAAISPVASPAGAALDNISAGGPYQNMGVPGAKSFHLQVAGYGQANPYFGRFAKSANSSVIQDAISQAPTFFSLWIGNNDVLSYASSGGIGVDQKGNLNPATYGSNDITDPGVVASVISGYVNALTANGAKGVIANIPNVTSIPYFTTVPAQPFEKLSTAQVSQLNAAYAQYNGGLSQAKAGGLISDAEYKSRLIKFTAVVPNGAVISDKDLTNLAALGLPSYRQTTAKDLILLTASSLLTPTAGGGTSAPLADQFVLTEKETAKVLTATSEYNVAITSIANSKGLALVDTNAKLLQLSSTSGLQFDGVRYTAKFVTGGSFSLDGVHLTGRGYGIIANEFLKQINAKYGSTLPMLDVNKYSGVTFP